MTPSSWKTKRCPVRPSPLWISSKTSDAPTRSAAARAAATYSGVSGMMPPSPMIGSRKIADVSGVTAALRAATSFGGRKTVVPTSGSKGFL